MHMVGQSSGRITRGTCTPPPCETRWLVPVKPYTAPKGSWEQAENMILLGVGVAAIIFGFAIIILGSVM